MIPKAVKDKVWLRAGGRCEDADEHGNRCTRPLDFRGLEKAHKIHRGMGGRKGKMKAIIDSEENIDLLCAYHHDVRDGRVKE